MPDMQQQRVTAYCLCTLAWGLSLFAWMTAKQLGFPDGHLTELDRARESLYEIFAGMNVALGAYFFYLGAAFRKQTKRARLIIALLIFLGLVMTAAIVDYSLYLQLDRGQGG